MKSPNQGSCNVASRRICKSYQSVYQNGCDVTSRRIKSYQSAYQNGCDVASQRMLHALGGTAPFLSEHKNNQSAGFDVASQKMLHALGDSVDKCINPALGPSNKKNTAVIRTNRNESIKTANYELATNIHTNANKNENENNNEKQNENEKRKTIGKGKWSCAFRCPTFLPMVENENENENENKNKHKQRSQKSLSTAYSSSNSSGAESVEISEPQERKTIGISKLIKNLNCFNKNGRKSEAGNLRRSEAKCVKQLTKENKEYAGILY